MKGTHLNLLVLCQILLASVLFHFTSLASASPLFEHQPVVAVKPIKQVEKNVEPKSMAPPTKLMEQKSAAAVQQTPKEQTMMKQKDSMKPDSVLDARSPSPLETPKVSQAAPAPISTGEQKKAEPVLRERKEPMREQAKPLAVEKPQPKVAVAVAVVKEEATMMARSSAEPVKVAQSIEPEEQKKAEVAPGEVGAPNAPTSPLATQQAELVKLPVVKEEMVPQPAALVVEPQKSAVVAQAEPSQSHVVKEAGAPPVSLVPIESQSQPIQRQVVAATPTQAAPVQSQAPVKPVESAPIIQESPSAAPRETIKSLVAPSPVVMGGLGPLHLLATTLCSYQPDKPVAEENLNQLYARRASVRKSLFEFMSLKFTNLEKLSSRLGYGLQVVPVKSPEDNKSPGVLPSHGWPVVGKCTAYDLKLMGEAAWCECQEGENCSKPQQDGEVKPTQREEAKQADDGQLAKSTTTSSQNNRLMSARSIDNSPSGTYSFLPSPEESSVISKILHVSDIKNAPMVESAIYNLNLTQHQLATLEAHATSTQECRRNALRYTKALFNHLAEDQRSVSEGWPKLYALISADDCARKRMIDIVNSLSGFRTDTTSIRRDNLEFAFAMDDLRAKVLENEVNVPLTFDRHFIEVEQFLQQSVRLMLANIPPKRAKLTSMRYRSLMYGLPSDEQCIDLHQRLLARNYPSDCNPTQFGQLPDVLRMTASSLELWSIEKELSMHTARVADYPNSSGAGQEKVNQDVNECIANLVSS